MTRTCPECGAPVSDDPKYCPSCGAALLAHTMELPKTDLIGGEPEKAEPSENERQDRRGFIRRSRRYGDTIQYDDHSALDADKPSDLSRKVSVSLYLSIIASVLAIAAIAMALIFVVVPSSAPASAADAATTAPTMAPTEPPTEPPIAGTYNLSEIERQKQNLYTLTLRASKIEMQPDYTGKVTLGSWELGSVKLNRETGTATFLGLEGKYSFDGTVLAIDYREATLVYKKEK